MADQSGKPFSDNDLDETRAALAPTLEATAAILPWVSKPQPVRFPPELNKRWEAACKELAERWAERHQLGATSVRSSIFSLMNVALESRDVDCLHLAETLASVADKLEEGAPDARLVAALTATCEALLEANGLENSAFISRAQHFSQRLSQCLLPSHKPGIRSDILDQLFVHDSEERLERMREALIVLPVDIYALQIESQGMVQQALEIDMYGIVHLGRQLVNYVALMNEAGEREQERARDEISALLDTISQALAAINP
jgi:hypothetical protein